MNFLAVSILFSQVTGPNRNWVFKLRWNIPIRVCSGSCFGSAHQAKMISKMKWKWVLLEERRRKRDFWFQFFFFYFFHLFTFYHRSKSWTAITLHFIRPWIPKCTLFMWKSKWLYQSEKRNKQWKSKIIHFLNKAKDCNASKPVSGFSSKLCTAFYFGKLFEN